MSAKAAFTKIIQIQRFFVKRPFPDRSSRNDIEISCKGPGEEPMMANISKEEDLDLLEA